MNAVSGLPKWPLKSGSTWSNENDHRPIVSKVWSFCTTLRDDGVGYGDYLEQLTYLIFLKMADEYAKPPYNRDVGIRRAMTGRA